ncbi:hypothetical protein TWF694_010441 [Orbilia ellipsospora]|uniref:Nephrocystin 3-like N-terminal domain-containing protein n=1 Tax=Orbilia ellipsospora TaxID=2528407 RepID=A0AAV9X9V8_9PEZI
MPVLNSKRIAIITAPPFLRSEAICSPNQDANCCIPVVDSGYSSPGPEIDSSLELDSGIIDSTTTTTSLEPISTDTTIVVTKRPGESKSLAAKGFFFKQKEPTLLGFPHASVPDECYKRFLDLHRLYGSAVKKKLNPKSYVSWTIKILGEDEERKRPFIVILCDPASVTKLRKFFSNKEIKQQCEEAESLPSLPILVVASQPIVKLASMLQVFGSTPVPLSSTTCGECIKIVHRGKEKIATIGGIIKVIYPEETVLYGMTAGHVVDEVIDDVQESDFGDASSPPWRAEESESTSESDEELNIALQLDITTVARPDPVYLSAETRVCNPDWRPIGRILRPNNVARGKETAGLDWALVEVDRGWPMMNTVKIREDTKKVYQHRANINQIYKVQDGPVSNRAVIYQPGGESSYLHGNICTYASYVQQSPSQHETRVYSMRCKTELDRVKSGDCGSWVIDAETGSVYGQIIAVDAFDEVYVVPLEDTIEEMKQLLGADEVCLPSPEDFISRCSEESKAELEHNDFQLHNKLALEQIVHQLTGRQLPQLRIIGLGELFTSKIVTLFDLASNVRLLCARYITSIRASKYHAPLEKIQKEAETFIDLATKIQDMLNSLLGERLKASQTLQGGIYDSQNLFDKLKRDIQQELGRVKLRQVYNTRTAPAIKKRDLDIAIKNLEMQKMIIILALCIEKVSITALLDPEQKLEELPVVKEAIFGSPRNRFEPQCLPKTQTEILKSVKEWIESPSENCVFWLYGMAGIGKSTIARTIASHLSDSGQLGASFFFKKSQTRRSTASNLFPTLAYSLAQNIPLLTPLILTSIKENPEAPSKALKEQFETFILGPILQLDNSLKTAGEVVVVVVVVIDALDECESEEDIPLVLHSLNRLSNLNSVHLRFFIASQSDFFLAQRFQTLTRSKVRSHDLTPNGFDHEVAERGIQIFLEHEFACIKAKRACEVPNNWPSRSAIQQLVHITNPSFISAAAISRFVENEHLPPAECLDNILAACYEKTGVHQVYFAIFEQILKSLDSTRDNSEIILEQSRKIISTIAVLESPLSRRSLSELTGVEPETIRQRLELFHSILVIPTDVDHPIEVSHRSLQEYLLNPDPKNRNSFCADEKEVHERVAADCIALMSKRLKINICNLRSPGTLVSDIDSGVVQQILPESLRYACQHWIHHLRRSQLGIYDDGPVHEFLKKHLLHWLEATSILGIFSRNTHGLEELRNVILNPNVTRSFSRFLWDAERFINFNQSGITQAPLQVYYSGLLFAPENSVVKSTFAPSNLSWVRKALKLPARWNPLTQILESHYKVRPVAFSPDGKLLALGLEIGKVELRDVISGAAVRTLNGDIRIKQMEFSPDGRFLASGSMNGTQIWDMISGAVVQPLNSNQDYTTSVAFSPDSRLLASGMLLRLVKLWDIATGTLVRTLDAHDRPISSVKFTPDGKLLVSASADRTIKLWDIASGMLVRTLNGHFGKITTIAISPDGNFLASASCDRTVRLWSIALEMRAPVQTLEMDFDVTSIVFSTDGKLLASASSDSTIKLWSVTSGILALLQTIEDTSLTSGLAFSPDSRLLASASGDKIVKLWDIALDTLKPIQTQERHHNHTVDKKSLQLSKPSSVKFLKLSPGGKLLVSISDSEAFKIWDVVSGALLKTLEGHSGLITSVAFSPGCKLLASASRNETVAMWDLESANLLNIYPINTARVSFSKDGGAIITDKDRINLPKPYVDSNPTVQVIPNFKEFLYHHSDGWLTLNGERIIWFPPYYQPSQVVAYHNLVAFGCKSGFVGTLEIDHNELRALICN